MNADKISYALCKQVPDMLRGFTIQTNYGDLFIDEDDAEKFARLAEKLLSDRLKRRVTLTKGAGK